MRVASQRALELPSTQLGHPFGPDWDVLTVRGRVFLLITEVTGHPQAICKAHPDDSLALRQAHADVVPGYHMNKRHWISLLGDDDEAVGRGGDPDAGGDADDGRQATAGLDEELVRELVTESYLLVIEKNLPRRDWPVDPASFVRRD